MILMENIRHGLKLYERRDVFVRFLSKKWTAVFALFLAFFVCVQPVSASNQLTLYARWNTQVTFDANGGVLAGGTTPEEKALAGKVSGTLTMSLNQAVSTGLIGSRTNFTYVGWNTQADGMGTWIEDYGRITGPVTFYAIYYQSNYYYTGAPQTFRVPIDGWYEIQLWGAEGGDDAAGEGGRGAYVKGEVYMRRGSELYVYVGAPGLTGTHGSGAGYNGGGNSGASSGGQSGSGGGATDVRTVYGNWNQNLDTRIAVAAGGGGAGMHRAGGYGGALVGGSTGIAGGTQTSAGPRGGFGYGGSSEVDGGGGGGGWYGGGASSGGSPGGSNDVGGGGGSSYLAGYGGCAPSPTGYTFRSGQMIAGNQTMPRPDGGQEVGHTGACQAKIRWIGS